MIGVENMTANGIELPEEIQGMLYEGYAVGDWTLGCVRGWLTAATFVFDDGATVSAYANTQGARDTQSRFSDSAIGYLSDPFGNPCVSGLKVSDAPAYITANAGAAALAGYANALNADNQITQTNIGQDGGVSTIASVLEANTQYATNQAYADAFSEGARWIRERQKQSFDAVYVKPGSSVVVNLQAELWIDQKRNARKVRYSYETSRGHETLD